MGLGRVVSTAFLAFMIGCSAPVKVEQKKPVSVKVDPLNEAIRYCDQGDGRNLPWKIKGLLEQRGRFDNSESADCPLYAVVHSNGFGRAVAGIMADKEEGCPSPKYDGVREGLLVLMKTSFFKPINYSTLVLIIILG